MRYYVRHYKLINCQIHQVIQICENTQKTNCRIFNKFDTIILPMYFSLTKHQYNLIYLLKHYKANTF